jgi:hypothetical protein
MAPFPDWHRDKLSRAVTIAMVVYLALAVIPLAVLYGFIVLLGNL